MSWTEQIPVVSGIGAAFAAGIMYAQLAAQRHAHDELKKDCASSAARQGERLGALESWQKSHDAVEGERRRRETHGIPTRDGTAE